MAIFKISELIDMAVRDEETGEAFYRALASKDFLAEAQSAFSSLADQERAHAKRYRALLAEAGPHTPRERHPGEYESYLSALLEMRAFPSPEKAAAGARALAGERAAAETALRMERDTLLFYLEMLPFLPRAHQRAVEDIIDEERQHIAALTDLVHRIA